jgi:hypothetical protein
MVGVSPTKLLIAIPVGETPTGGLNKNVLLLNRITTVQGCDTRKA